MKTYQTLTLGQFIELLESLGDAPVRGFNGKIHSYRGYYERNATTPCELVHTASELARWYRKEVGKDIQGWKGGDYTVSLDELLYYTEPRNTGPAVAGLERDGDGVYEPVGVLENFW